MSEPRKMTTDRHKSSLIVEGSVTTHGEQVAAKLAERAQNLSGETFAAPDFLSILTFFQAILEGARRKLVGADEAHRNELANDDLVRQERDAAAADLRGKIRTLRDAFRAAYGDAKAKDLGFDVRLSRTPVAVLAQGKRLLVKLDPAAPLPASDIPGLSMDSSLVPPLAEAVARLEAAIESAALEKTRADGTQVTKDLAMKEFDASFLRVARTLEAVYTLAGELSLAARVRPSRRRPGRTESVGNEPQEPDPEPEVPPIGFGAPLLP